MTGHARSALLHVITAMKSVVASNESDKVFEKRGSVWSVEPIRTV